MKRIVLKLSSSLVVNQGEIQKEWLSKLAITLKGLQSQDYRIWLITLGAGAIYKHSKGSGAVDQRAYYVGQKLLYKLYKDFFSEAGLDTMEILLNKDDFQKRNKYLRIKDLLATLSSKGVIPLINEKEYINSAHKFSDNDEIAGLVASLIDADKLILGSSVEGLLDKKDRCIKKVNFGEVFWSDYTRSEVSVTGRGGMLLKCRAAEHSAQRGVDAVICDGRDVNTLKEVVYGHNHGTLFVADKKKKARKRWIFDSRDFYAGEVTVDKGLASAIRSGKPVSILTVGISNVTEDFQEKQVVTIKDNNGILGYGEVRYDSEETSNLINEKKSKLLIHYNDYVRII